MSLSSEELSFFTSAKPSAELRRTAHSLQPVTDARPVEPVSWMLRRGVRAEWGTSADPEGLKTLTKTVSFEGGHAPTEVMQAAVPTLLMWTPAFVVVGLVVGYALAPFADFGPTVGLAVGCWPALSVGAKYIRMLLQYRRMTIRRLFRDKLDMAMAAPIALALALTAHL
jgi:hypothetical protein